MTRRDVNVKSFTFNSSTFFADFHFNYPLPGQLSRSKESFVDSKGGSISLFLDELPETQIDYDGSLTIFSDLSTSKFLTEFCYGVNSSIINYPSAVEEFRSTLSQIFEFNSAITCLPGGGYNLHHFLFEILPALLVFKDEIRNCEALILGSTPGATFLSEFNEILEISENLILVPIKSSIRVRKLTNITAVPFRIYPVDKILEVQTLLLEKYGAALANASPVVFIGRQDNDRNRRVLVNESDVIELLKTTFANLQVVRPGISKIAETVQSIRAAKILIGPTGGSLAHLIWARNLEAFIEIVPEGYSGDTETKELSKLMKFNYFRINSESLPNQEWNYSDQECNLIELTNLLTQNF
jgi:hypothetical protein